MANLRIPAKRLSALEAKQSSLSEKINKLTNVTRQQSTAVVTEKPDFEIVDENDST